MIHVVWYMLYVQSKLNLAYLPSHNLAPADAHLHQVLWEQVDQMCGPHTFDLMSLNSNAFRTISHLIQHFSLNVQMCFPGYEGSWIKLMYFLQGLWWHYWYVISKVWEWVITSLSYMVISGADSSGGPCLTTDMEVIVHKGENGVSLYSTKTKSFRTDKFGTQMGYCNRQGYHIDQFVIFYYGSWCHKFHINVVFDRWVFIRGSLLMSLGLTMQWLWLSQIQDRDMWDMRGTRNLCNV